EAWDLHDYPDRMQRATDAAVAAVHPADDFVAGGLPTQATGAELASPRPGVDDLARPTCLITAHAGNRQKYADEFNYQDSRTAGENLFLGNSAALRKFGLDPINGPVDGVAREVADSRIRDALLGILVESQIYAASWSDKRQKDPDLS